MYFSRNNMRNLGNVQNMNKGIKWIEKSPSTISNLHTFLHKIRRQCDVTGHLACPQRPYGAFAARLRRPVSAATSLRLFWACSKLGGDLGDLGDLTAICSAATALYDISQRPSGDQRRSGRFCRSQRGRRPVWLGYNRTLPTDSHHRFQ